MKVDRCICLGCSFYEILRRHEDGQSLSEIVQETGCGTGCGMCRPYIKLVIITNRYNFDLGSVESLREKIDKVDDPLDW